MKWSNLMKTKSKRFLNLATLCLALLGTTLLMGHPVKAEEGRSNQQEVSVSRQSGQSDGEDLSEDSDDNYPYAKGHYAGQDFGYKEGLEAGWQEADPKEPQDIPEPESNPYGSEGEDSSDFKEGFRDGYPGGYVEGWRKSHPLWAIVQDFLPWLYNFLR
ncbi:TPA: hypothetical protein VJJ15_000729 [Streptococcus pyogenes]|nr:hypothetical protein [Streptococcus pyogenes]HER1448884.1 hypothetical protein [Streptococcus pyogenes]HER1464262.1 hypothetical protein [Streptococcus pyogenes]HER1481333.1 hypothetical protein [Streptococcus pyogenes]HER1484651.1 hypothetical protein [Streptococcus pyogenes]